MQQTLHQEILGKLESAYIAAMPADARPAIEQTLCVCPAFSFMHLRFAGDCNGGQ
jgi:hypothetical protein